MSVSIRTALGPIKKGLLLTAIGVAGLYTGYGINGAFFSNDSPIQPINFSHRTHAGENDIPCQYCHIYARRSISAGVPSVNKCVNCHKSMIRTHAEITKLFEYWQAREPIPWIKVHDLPDFVYFPHKRHIAAGVDCSACHGQVATMARVTKVASLQMGWCRDCHQKLEVKNGQQCSTCHN
ncbi:MAG TPA: menaquinol oxidoreductase [Porticoccus sp.]|nr:menaquinol oxidoreductase [Porticoccus sp.]